MSNPPAASENVTDPGPFDCPEPASAMQRMAGGMMQHMVDLPRPRKRLAAGDAGEEMGGGPR